MLGTLVNVAVIVAASVAGTMIGTGIGDRFKTGVIQGLSPCILMIGASMTLANLGKSGSPVLSGHSYRGRFSRPVLHFQSGEASKFTFVIGDQGEAFGQGLGGDQQIVSPDW